MRVLHVDDEPDIRDIAQLSLELDPRFEVDSACSAAVALDRIDAAKPDIILLDVMMPDMDGPGLFRVLRERGDTSDIPVIFMTAAAQRVLVRDLMAMGAIGVISKPFDPINLAGELRSLLTEAGLAIGTGSRVSAR